MNLIFMRHGEATDNVKELISDKEIYWSVLTKNGESDVLNSIKKLPPKIDKVYVSPFPRTIQTAHFVYQKHPEIEFLIDDRIREINNGKYSGKKNNEDLDETRRRQIEGDYFVRFGEYGENKFDIETRLCSFLQDVYANNFNENKIIIVSHGSIISYMKRILNLKTPHIKTGEVEEFNSVDFSFLFKHIKKLNKEKKMKIKERLEMIETLNIKQDLKNSLIRISKQEFNNIEFSDGVFKNFIDGIKTSSLKINKKSIFDKNIILICFYNNFENFIKTWMDHYIAIGVSNFIMVDNNSKDNSTLILNGYSNIVNIDFWEIKEKYDCIKMCGWKQQILEKYGPGRKYLTVDSDELFVYEDYKKKSIHEFLKKTKNKYIKSLMMDVYTNISIKDSENADFIFVDKNTYKKTMTNSYKERFYGGPRSRVFGIKPSLQKIPLIFYTGKEVFANDHFYYPWLINKKAKFCAYLLHYKFLPGDIEKYAEFVKDERHWNNSREYKVYEKVLTETEGISFYDEDYSILIEDVDYPI